MLDSTDNITYPLVLKVLLGPFEKVDSQIPFCGFYEIDSFLKPQLCGSCFPGDCIVLYQTDINVKKKKRIAILKVFFKAFSKECRSQG